MFKNLTSEEIELLDKPGNLFDYEPEDSGEPVITKINEESHVIDWVIDSQSHNRKSTDL